MKISNEIGFSLIEVITVFAIMAILVGISFTSYRVYQQQNGLTIATNTIVNSIKIAKEKASFRVENSSWGVEIEDTKTIIFKGDDYGTRDTSFDIVMDLPKGLEITGSSTIIFINYTGLIDTPGSITISNPHGYKSIEFNQKGTVSY